MLLLLYSIKYELHHKIHKWKYKRISICQSWKVILKYIFLNQRKTGIKCYMKIVYKLLKLERIINNTKLYLSHLFKKYLILNLIQRYQNRKVNTKSRSWKQTQNIFLKWLKIFAQMSTCQFLKLFLMQSQLGENKLYRLFKHAKKNGFI